jgi:hypothetical protein
MDFLDSGQKVIARSQATKQSQEVQRGYFTKAEQRRIIRNDDFKRKIERHLTTIKNYSVLRGLGVIVANFLFFCKKNKNLTDSTTEKRIMLV